MHSQFCLMLCPGLTCAPPGSVSFPQSQASSPPGWPSDPPGPPADCLVPRMKDLKMYAGKQKLKIELTT